MIFQGISSHPNLTSISYTLGMSNIYTGTERLGFKEEDYKFQIVKIHAM